MLQGKSWTIINSFLSLNIRCFKLNKEELIARLEAPMQAQMVANSTALIESNDLDVNDLLEVTFYKKKEVAFRAAWILEHVMTHKPTVFCGHLHTFFELLPDQKNQSAMRHYAKIVALLTAKKVNPIYKEALKQVDFEPVIELLFIWLVEADVLVATKVHCMQALANLAPNHDWIKDELLQTVDYLTDIESYAFFARAKMVKKALKKI